MTRGQAVTVLGEKRLAATLAKAAHDMEDMDAAGTRAARSVQLRARANAPKRSGRLANSIRADAKGGTAEVSTNLVYAGVIHNGWPAHNIRARPFLLPVAAATEPVWRTYYVTEARTILNQVKGA